MFENIVREIEELIKNLVDAQVENMEQEIDRLKSLLEELDKEEEKEVIK